MSRTNSLSGRFGPQGKKNCHSCCESNAISYTAIRLSYQGCTRPVRILLKQSSNTHSFHKVCLQTLETKNKPATVRFCEHLKTVGVPGEFVNHICKANGVRMLLYITIVLVDNAQLPYYIFYINVNHKTKNLPAERIGNGGSAWEEVEKQRVNGPHHSFFRLLLADRR